MASRQRDILTIDIGNTAMKAAVYSGERLTNSVTVFGSDFEVVDTMLTFNAVEGISYCCVGVDPTGIYEKIREYGLPVTELTPTTPLPISVDYDRALLGVDRVAAAVGVARPGEAALVVDAGTALTVDLVAGMAFKGGNISPGLKLRFHSLHRFTSRLPLVSPDGELPDFGHDTDTAIRAGVVGGLAAEIAADLETARTLYPNIRLVLTGGDAALLEPVLAARGIHPVADSEAVGRGLVRIFNHNNDL